MAIQTTVITLLSTLGRIPALTSDTVTLVTTAIVTQGISTLLLDHPISGKTKRRLSKDHLPLLSTGRELVRIQAGRKDRRISYRIPRHQFQREIGYHLMISNISHQTTQCLLNTVTTTPKCELDYRA